MRASTTTLDPKGRRVERTNGASAARTRRKIPFNGPIRIVRSEPCCRSGRIFSLNRLSTTIGNRTAFERSADPPEFELFDLRSDPWEFKDLADNADHAEILTRLKKALLAWRRETNDPLLTPAGTKAVARFQKVKRTTTRAKKK